MANAYSGMDVEGGRPKEDVPPPRYSTFMKEERSSVSGCALFMLLTIVACGGATLASSTKDNHWFQQNVTVGATNEARTVWVTLGNFQTRFGWESWCYRKGGSSTWSCFKYNDFTAVNADNVQLLGKMSYAAGAVSVAVAGLMILGLLAASKRQSGRGARAGMGCLALLMGIYYFSVVVISFVVYVLQFLDDLGVGSNVNCGWAYGLSLIICLFWFILSCCLM